MYSTHPLGVLGLKSFRSAGSCGGVHSAIRIQRSSKLRYYTLVCFRSSLR
jgi:hypothetical protein